MPKPRYAQISAGETPYVHVVSRAYVDLNPIRAKMAATPEKSKHTSVKRRCEAATSEGRVKGVIAKQPAQLERFAGNPRENMPCGLPFRLTDYLELVYWTGRQMRRSDRQ